MYTKLGNDSSSDDGIKGDDDSNDDIMMTVMMIRLKTVYRLSRRPSVHQTR